MNMEDLSEKCAKKFLEKAEEKKLDMSKMPPQNIIKYCRMLIVYCDADGKVSESFQKSMEKCAEEILSVEGAEEIFNALNKCPE